MQISRNINQAVGTNVRLHVIRSDSEVGLETGVVDAAAGSADGRLPNRPTMHHSSNGWKLVWKNVRLYYFCSFLWLVFSYFFHVALGLLHYCGCDYYYAKSCMTRAKLDSIVLGIISFLIRMKHYLKNKKKISAK